jgi:hypothetical protein
VLLLLHGAVERGRQWQGVRGRRRQSSSGCSLIQSCRAFTFGPRSDRRAHNASVTVKECRRVAGSARPDSRAIAGQRHTVGGDTPARPRPGREDGPPPTGVSEPVPGTGMRGTKPAWRQTASGTRPGPKTPAAETTSRSYPPAHPAGKPSDIGMCIPTTARPRMCRRPWAGHDSSSVTPRQPTKPRPTSTP